MAHQIKALLSHYDAAFQQKFGEPAPINGSKDSAIAKRLLAKYPFDRLCRLIDEFFASGDEWIEQCGYTFGAFSVCIGKLITARPKRDKWSGLKDFVNG